MDLLGGLIDVAFDVFFQVRIRSSHTSVADFTTCNSMIIAVV